MIVVKGAFVVIFFFIVNWPRLDELNKTLVDFQSPLIACYMQKGAHNIGPLGTRSLPPRDLKTCHMRT